MGAGTWRRAVFGDAKRHAGGREDLPRSLQSAMRFICRPVQMAPLSAAAGPTRLGSSGAWAVRHHLFRAAWSLLTNSYEHAIELLSLHGVSYDRFRNIHIG